MNDMLNTPKAHVISVEDRARQSLGSSIDAVYTTVAGLIAEQHSKKGVLVDVGCGSGKLWPYVKQNFSRYVGVDVLRPR